MTDTRANTYRRAVQLNETADVTSLAVFYAENIAGGANTVTVEDTLPGLTLRVAILEYAGVAPTNSLDATTTAQGTSPAPTSGTVTTTAGGDLVIGGIDGESDDVHGGQRVHHAGTGAGGAQDEVDRRAGSRPRLARCRPAGR